MPGPGTSNVGMCSTLCAGMLFFCPLPHLFAYPPLDQSRHTEMAIDLFRGYRLGVSATRDTPFVHLFKMPPATTDDDLEVLLDAPFEFGLDLSGTRVTGQGLGHLRRLNSLVALDLDGQLVTDDDLRHLRGTKLRKLSLKNTNVSNAGVAELRELGSTLEDLSVANTWVSQGGLAQIVLVYRHIDLRRPFLRYPLPGREW